MVDGRSTQAHLYDRDAARQLAAHLRAHSRNSHSRHHDVEIDAFAHRHGLRRRAAVGAFSGRFLLLGSQRHCVPRSGLFTIEVSRNLLCSHYRCRSSTFQPRHSAARLYRP